MVFCRIYCAQDLRHNGEFSKLFAFRNSKQLLPEGLNPDSKYVTPFNFSFHATKRIRDGRAKECTLRLQIYE